MIKHLFTLLLSISIVLTVYLSAKLYLGTRGSRLYSSSALVGFIVSIYSIANIVSMYVSSNIIVLIINLLFMLIALCMYFLWRTTYNQIKKNSYHIFIILFVLLQIVSDIYVFYFPDGTIRLFSTVSEYNIMSLIVLAFVSFQYFRFSKMNNTTHLNSVPFLLLIYTMSQLATVVTTDVVSYVFSLIMSVSMLFIVYFYTEDYKRSFYY